MSFLLSSYLDHFGPKAKAIISFDRESKEYYPGEKIRGTVLLRALRLNAFEGVKVTLQGKIRTNDGPIERTFFEKQDYLVGKENGITSIPDGEHVLNFDIQLADDLPCSFLTGQHGSIKYFFDLRITATLRPVLWNIQTFSVVTKPLVKWIERGDRLYDPIILDRINSSMFLGSGNIKFTFKTDKRGFEPLEEIRFALNILNETKKHVRSMHLQLLQVLKYTQTSRHESIVLAEITGPAVPLGLQKIWEDSLQVPKNVVPCRFGYSKFMEIILEYKLKLILQMSGSLIPNMKEEMEIFIESPLSSNVLTKWEDYNGSARLNSAGGRLSCYSSMSSVASSSFGATPSLPGYEKALTCKKLHTAPPSYRSDM